MVVMVRGSGRADHHTLTSPRLFPSHLVSSHLTSSHLVSSLLFPSLLTSPHLVSSRLFSSLLTSSLLFSPHLVSSHYLISALLLPPSLSPPRSLHSPFLICSSICFLDCNAPLCTHVFRHAPARVRRWRSTSAVCGSPTRGTSNGASGNR